MIGIQYQLTNQDGETITLNDHVTDPLNVIALQDYPSFDLEIKNQEIQKEGQHGIWDFFSFYGKRLITFSGVIVGENEENVMEIQDQLKLVCGLPIEPTDSNSGIITIKYTDPRGRALQTTGKIYSSPRFSRVMREQFKLAFQIVLKSADPTIESQDLVADTGTRGYFAGSIQLPTKIATTMPIGEKQAIIVTNNGNAYSNPTITIHGPLTNPRIDNLTTAKYTALTYALTAGHYLIINTADGTVVDDLGVDQSAHLDSGSEFIKLKNGNNVILLTSAENEGATDPIATRIAPTEAMEITHRDMYL